MINKNSIFAEYYKIPDTICDRLKVNGEDGMDVIIPLFNSNELFERNLYNYYKEIPINRLLIGDGGCTDESLDILQRFPRVEIYNQSSFKTLGYCISDLIKKVKTDWFIYLHADVYLPENWFDVMVKHKNEYDWFECNRRLSIMFDFSSESQNKAQRAYSGSQVGKKDFFNDAINKVDDDYLYRNEDIVFRELVESNGGRYGRVSETYHHHQLMNKRGEKEPNINNVKVIRDKDYNWEKKTLDMQARGIIKYTKPKKHLIPAVNAPLKALGEMDALDWNEFKEWVGEVSPEWLKYIKKPRKNFSFSFYKNLINKIINK